MKKSHAARLLALALILMGCSPQQGQADLIITNANIYTHNPAQPQAQAVAVRNGKVIFVGDAGKAAAYVGDSTRVTDLQDKTVLPALIDSHTHPGMVAITSSNGELAKYILPNTSKEDIYEYLRQVARENPDLPFLMIGQWANPLFGVEGPDRKDIDEIFPNTVVILLDSSGHSYWLNTAAFRALGIDENTPDLKPGLSFFVRDENGRKTGWVKEFVLMPYLASMPQPDPALLAPAIADYLNYLLSKGVSTVMDAGNFNSEETIYQAVHLLDQQGKLPLRYEATHHLFMPDQLATAVDDLLALKQKHEGPRLKFNTIKTHFDGVNEINTAALLQDFANEPGNRGGMLYSEQELKDLLLQLAKHQFNLHLHSVGDRAVRTALNAMEQAQKEYGGKLPVELTLSHLEVVSPEDMPRFAELGVHANFPPTGSGAQSSRAPMPPSAQSATPTTSPSTPS